MAVPVPVAAPSESLPPASLAPESSRDDPFAELSAGPVSAAPLLHPQRQRELIEQAAGMSTRQVAVLLAAAAPEVVPPRDTLRAVAPDRYTLKVTIDQECEHGLRLLKDLVSHLDPRMSWGDLVARPVREAVARHDPRGGGNGQRRQRSAGASPRRAPNRTPAATAPAAPARRGGGDTPAPQGDTAATERQNPSAMPANAAPPHATRDTVRSRHQSPPRRHIPAAVQRHVWQRDEGRCCYRDPLTGRRCASSHLLQIDHLLPVAQGGGEDPGNLRLA